MHEMIMPQLGQSVEEAQIVSWLRQEGDRVETGEPLLTIQTDKAEIEVEATAAGVLRKILVQPGEDVPVKSVIAWIGEADEALPALPGRSGAPGTASAGAVTQAALPAEIKDTAFARAEPSGDRPRVSPRARRIAAEHHIAAERLAGTGAMGRVTEADVMAYASTLHAARMTPTARRIAGASALDVSGIEGTGVGGRIARADVEGRARAGMQADRAQAGHGDVKRVPLTPMRRIIAERMSASKFTAPHYYVTVEVDMAAAKSFRAACTAFKPSFNDLVMYAIVLALKEYPAVNARWAGDAIEEVEDINLGMAVALPTGLIVPVIRAAQSMNLQSLSAAAKALAEKAQKGKLLPDDYQGNTFTVSNLGPFGVESFTAIINQPDSAIVAVGQMKDRVVAIDGGIHIRPILKATISSDHRVIDGAVAAQFMGRVKAILEAGAFEA